MSEPVSRMLLLDALDVVGAFVDAADEPERVATADAALTRHVNAYPAETAVASLAALSVLLLRIGQEHSRMYVDELLLAVRARLET